MRANLGLLLIALIVGISVILPMVQAHPVWTGKVTWVIDGDTMIIGSKTVRLALTDAYEITGKGDSYDIKAKAAKNYVISVCYGKTATVHVDSKQPLDKFGRTVAEINCPYSFLNYQILNKGYGTIDTRYCSISEFANEWWAVKFGC